jgi:hypothetical protein
MQTQRTCRTTLVRTKVQEEHHMKKLISGFTFFALSGLLTAASIDPVVLALPDKSYTFSGGCTDCTGTATGTLTVTGNYLLGSALSIFNFVSFTYDGTNLLPAYTITAAQTPFVSGSLPATLPSSASLDIASSSVEFLSFANGFWCTGPGCAADFGGSNSFTPAAVTPEPASLGLLTLGFAGIALRLRKRS